MRIGGYPDMDQQGRKHREFLLSLAEMERKSLQQDVSEEMADFLKGWISVHIMEDDKAFFMRS